jgi:phage shock protein A
MNLPRQEALENSRLLWDHRRQNLEDEVVAAHTRCVNTRRRSDAWVKSLKTRERHLKREIAEASEKISLLRDEVASAYDKGFAEAKTQISFLNKGVILNSVSSTCKLVDGRLVPATALNESRNFCILFVLRFVLQ